jgi:hypothetical protein
MNDADHMHHYYRTVYDIVAVVLIHIGLLDSRMKSYLSHHGTCCSRELMSTAVGVAVNKVDHCWGGGDDKLGLW